MTCVSPFRSTWEMIARGSSFAALILLDMLVIVACITAVVSVRYLLGGQFSFKIYFSQTWIPALFLCIALGSGLYQVNLQTPAEEIKKLTWVTSLFFMMLALLTFLTHEAKEYSRSIFLISWALTLFALPIVRAGSRKLLPCVFLRKFPCVIIGQVENVEIVLRHMANGVIRLQPVAVCVAPGGNIPFEVQNVAFEELPGISVANPNCYAMLLVDQQDRWSSSDTCEQLSFHFRHLLLGSAQTFKLSQWACGVDVGGMTFLTCQYKLLDPWRLRFKRLFDISFCIMAGFALLPSLVILAILIKCGSRGPIFYSQYRLGQSGKSFRIYKFRTMHLDAERQLERLLNERKDVARQWEGRQKIKDDPRITRVGYWLRKTSLDELPQIYNVMRGEMSLVGPRPIVQGEVAKYGAHYKIYSKVKPGITGLWQVSSRYDISYAQRVAFDVAYVRNWSFYTDIWLLARTVREIYGLTGR